MNYTALDFETANSSRASVCAVGVVRVENGAVVERKHQLIRPDGRFDYRNVMVHGITDFDVRDAPSFADYWDELRPFLCDNVIAHNAAFDITCLRESLDFYGLAAIDFKYMCTLNISRKILGLSCNKLDVLASHFNLGTFRHHNALEDAAICAKLFDMLAERTDVSKFAKNFIIKKLSAKEVDTHLDNDRDFTAKAGVAEEKKEPAAEIIEERPAPQKAVQPDLFDYCKKVSVPQIVRKSPQRIVRGWRSAEPRPISEAAHNAVRSCQPRPLSKDVSLDEDSAAPQAIADLKKAGKVHTLEGMLNLDFSPIDFSKNFVVTGIFTSIPRRDAENIITYHGGNVQRKVEADTDYVIVGDVPSQSWFRGEFGVVIDRALAISHARFVTESHFLKESM